MKDASFQDLSTLLRALPPEVGEVVRSLSFLAASRGCRAYLVGGFVRDLLLGRRNLDVDVMVPGDGIAFAREYAALVHSGVLAHPRFGTATVSPHKGLKVDVSTARRETYRASGRLPEVEPGSLKDDLFRRDFTVNAMAIDLTPGDFGALVDYYGGWDDLCRRRIRVLHDESFRDDPTRILRAIRFAKRYGFSVEAHTAALLRAAVKEGVMRRVHAHRWRDELVLLLKEEDPVPSLSRIAQGVGFSWLDRRITLNGKSRALLRALAAQAAWFEEEFPQRRRAERWVLYLMALCDSLPLSGVTALCGEFALSRGVALRLESVKRVERSALRVLSESPVTASKVHGILEPLSYEAIIFLRAKCRGKRAAAGRIAAFLRRHHGLKLHIGGDDLRAMGLPAGPEYQRVLSRVMAARLDGKVRTKDEELSLAARLAARSIRRRTR
jgi:tRNA nucleotidyltransferase (CCA-adding enzyme)